MRTTSRRVLFVSFVPPRRSRARENHDEMRTTVTKFLRLWTIFPTWATGGEKRRNKRKYKQKKNTKKDITTTSFCEMWKYLYSNDRCPSLPPFSLLRHMFLRHAIFKITFVINENKCTLSIILLRSNPLPRYSPFFLILISRSQDYDLVLNTSTTRDYEYTIVNLASRIVLVRILFPSFRVKINQSAS